MSSKSKYMKENLKAAAGEVRVGTMTLREASQRYGVPRSTISDRVTGRVPEGAIQGSGTVFPSAYESELCTKIKQSAKMGFGLSRLQVMKMAGRAANKLKLKHSFKNGVASKNWYYGFLKRHPDLSLRKPQKLSTVRSKCMDANVVDKYFEELGSILQKGNAPHPTVTHVPKKIWNMDESGFNLEHNPVKIVGEKGSRNVNSRVSTSRENITVLACVSADGECMPPMFVCKGKTKRPLLSFNPSDSPEGALWTTQDKGWMDDSLGSEWFKNLFLPSCGPERPQLLILDQHHSHEVAELVLEAERQNIVILGMPPHCSHWLQPLDKGCFGPLTRKYHTICSEFMSSSLYNVVTKASFAKLFAQAWADTMTEVNIKKGFKVTGISPFNPAIVPAHAFAPCLQTAPIFPQEPTLALQQPTPQEPTLAVTPQEPILAVTPQEPTLAVTPQEPTLAVTPQEQTLAVTPQEPTLAVTPQELTLAYTSKDRTQSLTPHETALTPFSHDILQPQLSHSNTEIQSTLTVQPECYGNIKPVITDPVTVQALLSVLTDDSQIIDITPEDVTGCFDDIFDVTTPKNKMNDTQVARKSRAIKSHRLLTGPDVIKMKLEEIEKREQKQRQKEEREKKKQERAEKDGKGKIKGKGKGKGKGVKKQQTQEMVLGGASYCIVCMTPDLSIPYIVCDTCHSLIHHACVPHSYKTKMTEAIEDCEDFQCHLCFIRMLHSVK